VLLFLDLFLFLNFFRDKKVLKKVYDEEE